MRIIEDRDDPPIVGGWPITFRLERSGGTVEVSRHPQYVTPELESVMNEVVRQVEEAREARDEEAREARDEEAREARDEAARASPCRPGYRFACDGDPSCPSCDVCLPICIGPNDSYVPGSTPSSPTPQRTSEEPPPPRGPGSCQSDADCGSGMRCNTCAHGSCDSCDDCVAACEPR